MSWIPLPIKEGGPSTAQDFPSLVWGPGQLSSVFTTSEFIEANCRASRPTFAA